MTVVQLSGENSASTMMPALAGTPEGGAGSNGQSVVEATVVTSNWACISCNRLDWPVNSLNEHGCVHDIALEQVLVEAITVLNAGVADF